MVKIVSKNGAIIFSEQFFEIKWKLYWKMARKNSFREIFDRKSKIAVKRVEKIFSESTFEKNCIEKCRKKFFQAYFPRDNEKMFRKMTEIFFSKKFFEKKKIKNHCNRKWQKVSTPGQFFELKFGKFLKNKKNPQRKTGKKILLARVRIIFL